MVIIDNQLSFMSRFEFAGFALVMIVRRKENFLKRGEITGFYLIWYGMGRMVIEGMRTDSLLFAGLRVSQWLSAVLVVAGIILVIYQTQKKTLLLKS